MAPNLLFTGLALYKTFVAHETKSDPYQAWWVGLMGTLTLTTAVVLLKKKIELPGPAWLTFLGVSWVGVMAEELTCYLLGTGRFRSPGDPRVLFFQGSLALYLACIGGWVAWRFLELRW